MAYRWHNGKEISCQDRRRKRHGFDPWVGKTPWKKKWQFATMFLPAESHGHRSLVDYSPCGLRESDMPEHTCTHTHTQWKITKYPLFKKQNFLGKIIGKNRTKAKKWSKWNFRKWERGDQTPQQAKWNHYLLGICFLIKFSEHLSKRCVHDSRS